MLPSGVFRRLTDAYWVTACRQLQLLEIDCTHRCCSKCCYGLSGNHCRREDRSHTRGCLWYAAGDQGGRHPRAGGGGRVGGGRRHGRRSGIVQEHRTAMTPRPGCSMSRAAAMHVFLESILLEIYFKHGPRYILLSTCLYPTSLQFLYRRGKRFRTNGGLLVVVCTEDITLALLRDIRLDDESVHCNIFFRGKARARKSIQ